MSRIAWIALLLVFALAAPAGVATAQSQPGRSLLFTAPERALLGCIDRGLAAATQPPSPETVEPEGPSPSNPAPSVPAPSPTPAGPVWTEAHLASLVYRSPESWEIRLNGLQLRPGRPPAGLIGLEVRDDGVTLVRRDPATGERQTLRLGVGERRSWPLPLAVRGESVEHSNVSGRTTAGAVARSGTPADTRAALAAALEGCR